ncbi:Eukaryotic translation initiation factor 3 subunit G [Micractinium conductrix]|uniref:Eukaryotic translation initiation factor 3 subunit G n=1 Tax=Micractinium conductrix TaxID=554055 RepID=A0A2P6VA85_9CHLO|nr:Eukaryotic translation initiation factor 3 subunit G [Micractinium conductrix]|eukprot:PSC71007.1 Eukaryotic translation initiation factor 3 subunit G [Micractinium conductrix]
MAKWGDLLEEEEELPQSTTTGPDAKGVVTKVEYYRNEKGEVMKKTTKTRVVKIEKKVYQVAQDRRASWRKFGEAASERATDSVTSQTPDEVQMERIHRQKQTQEEKAAKGAADFASAMQGGDKSAIVGSLRDMLYKKRMERQLLAAKGLIAAPERPPDEDGPGGSLPAAGKAGGWVPPSLRNRVGGGDAGPGEAMRRRDENSVRVSNLSEDVTEDDLAELFGPFGPIQRIFVAKDRETGESRGFAFINFIHREDANRAIAKLDGFGYDNLILSVSMAAPRPERP